MKTREETLRKRGLFIAFEGGEGTGKSTQIKASKLYLEALGFEVVISFEPGGTPLGQKIRQLLLDPANIGMGARTEALLYAAARAEHVEKILRPALDRGAVVLCDRYWDASRAYQGVGRNLGIAAVDHINAWGTHGLLPDKVFVFDLDVQQGLERALKRNEGELDRLEAEGQSFHEKVRIAYRHLSKQQPHRYCLVDASQDKESIQKLLQKEMSEWTTIKSS